jgi:FMN-dependent NADH-azoreductase
MTRRRLTCGRFSPFIGIKDVEFVYAEGLAIGEASRLQALSSAHAQIDAMVTPALEAA